jgi:hypothetical protein
MKLRKLNIRKKGAFMKQLLAILMTLILMAGPGMAAQMETKTETTYSEEPVKEGWDNEEFGKNFFEYAGGVMLFPVYVGEKAVRTLLFMDKPEEHKVHEMETTTTIEHR